VPLFLGKGLGRKEPLALCRHPLLPVLLTAADDADPCDHFQPFVI
jgi:hypothetical protein